MKFWSYLAFTIFPACFSSTDMHKPSFLTTKSFLSIRGGDLGPFKSKSLSQMFTLLPALDALRGTLAPASSVSQVLIEIDKGSFDEILMLEIGLQASGVAIANYLATTGKTSINEAIGYGILTRIILGIKIALTHLDHAKNSNHIALLLIMGALSTCTYSLISGELDTSLCGKIAASLLGLLGVTASISPEMATKGVFNIDIEEDETRKLVKIWGMYLLIGSLQTTLYLNSVNPVQAVSYMSLFFIPFMLRIPESFSVENYTGMSVKTLSVLIVSLLTAFACGTLA